jgi:DNA repair protein RadC
LTSFDNTRMQPGNKHAENYVREVTARYIGPRRKGLTISGPGDAACFMRGLLRDEVREHFLALYLNGAHHVLSFSLVSLGGAT